MTILKKGYFDIKRDMAIVKASGFSCQACLVARPETERSPDPRYCQSCYDFLQQDGKKAVEPSKDYYWAQDGTFFVLEGRKYGVTKTGATVCLGGAETPPTGGETPQNGQEPVSKLSEVIPLPPEEPQAQNKEVVLKHPGGRPRKKDGEKFSRVTAWRREKEKQGVLFD